MPTLGTFEAVVQTLGFDIVLRAREEAIAKLYRGRTYDEVGV